MISKTVEDICKEAEDIIRSELENLPHPSSLPEAPFVGITEEEILDKTNKGLPPGSPQTPNPDAHHAKDAMDEENPLANGTPKKVEDDLIGEEGESDLDEKRDYEGLVSELDADLFFQNLFNNQITKPLCDCGETVQEKDTTKCGFTGEIMCDKCKTAMVRRGGSARTESLETDLNKIQCSGKCKTKFQSAHVGVRCVSCRVKKCATCSNGMEGIKMKDAWICSKKCKREVYTMQKNHHLVCNNIMCIKKIDLSTMALTLTNNGIYCSSSCASEENKSFITSLRKINEATKMKQPY